MHRFPSLLLRLYRQLLALYPADYRQYFGEEMEEIFQQQLSTGGGKQALIFLREVRDLPMNLLNAYGRQRQLAFAGAPQRTQIESLAIRLSPWVWGMILSLFVAAILSPVWLTMQTSNNQQREASQLRGSSAIILEDNGKFARLPQGSFSCVTIDGKNQARCTVDFGREQLQLLLTTTIFSHGGFSGDCAGSYAGEDVHCHQLFMRAKDYSMPPVTVIKPRAMSDSQWRELMNNYSFTYQSANQIFPWWVVAGALLSLVVAVVMWLAGGTAHIQDSIPLGRLIASIGAAILCFIPTAWFALLIAFQVERWFERF